MRASAFVFLGVFLMSPCAFALDAGIIDAGLPDVLSLDAGESDAANDAEVDAATDASTVDAASDASPAKDASTGSDASGLCCPSLPCTCPSEGGTDDGDAGNSETGGGGGCSCESAPLGVDSTSPLFLIAAATLVRWRRRKKK